MRLLSLGISYAAMMPDRSFHIVQRHWLLPTSWAGKPYAGHPLVQSVSLVSRWCSGQSLVLSGSSFLTLFLFFSSFCHWEYTQDGWVENSLFILLASPVGSFCLSVQWLREGQYVLLRYYFFFWLLLCPFCTMTFWSSDNRPTPLHVVLNLSLRFK